MPQLDQSTVALTMTPDAAEKFLSALMWSMCVAEGRVDHWREQDNPDRVATFSDHAEWLRWAWHRLNFVLESDRG